MSTYTSALTTIEKVATSFLFAYKHSTEDYSLYVEHLCRAIQDFNLYDGQLVVSEKVTIDPVLKCISMPDDMQQFVDLVTPINGTWWSFTEKSQMVNTTTTIVGVESRDSTQGEGVTMDQVKVTGYGAKGGWNKFRYTVDWVSRRIYVDDTYESTDYIVLLYVSSGIKATEETTIPTFLVPMLDAYLLLKETYWIPEVAREREIRDRDYWREKMKVRNLINSMTYNQWRDMFLGSYTQAPQR
jgi:hypothetical protein